MIKLGLIGCGMIVKSQIAGYKEIMGKNPDFFRIVAACDVQEERARNIAEQVATFQKGGSPKVYTDYKRMVEAESLDAVSVATPHFAHHEPSIYALNAGIHVVVEKPFAITIKAGQKMIDAAEKNKCVLACAEPLRRTVTSRMVNWAINKARLIGNPRFFLYHRTGYHLGVVVGTPWRHQKVKAGGGWVLDGEVHYTDFLRMVFGDVDEVYAKIKNFEPTRYLNPVARVNPVPSDVEDTAFALLTFKSGLIGSFIWTFAAIGEPIVIVRYYGSEGSIDHVGVVQKGVVVRTKDGGQIPGDDLQKRFMESLSQEEKERLFPLGMTNDYSFSFFDFFDSVVNKRQPEISGREAFAAQAVCEAMYESDIKGQAVSVKDVMEGRIDTFQREINGYWKI